MSHYAARFWDSFLHAGIDVRRSKLRDEMYVVSVYSVLGVVSVGLFGLLHVLTEHNYVVGYLELAGSLTMLINFLALGLTHNTQLARSGLLLSILALLVVMLLTGGTQGSGVFWFFLFPVSAFFLSGKKQGILWVCAMFGVIVGTLVLNQSSVVDMPYTLTQIRQLLVTLLVVSVGIYVYQQSRENLESRTRQSQYDLQEQKVRAGTVLDNIDEGVITIDTEGRVLLLNRSAEEMLGWTSKELLGKRFVDMVPLLDSHGQVIAPAERPIRQALDHPIENTVMLTYKRKDGSLLPVAIAGRPITVRGKVVGTIGTFRDVSEERAVDRAKSEFVTLASHQLRTPIATISWLTELLLSGDIGKLKPDQQEHVQKIYQSNRRMAALVSEMLIVSSLELGSQPVNPQSTDITAICRQVVRSQIKLLPARAPSIEESYEAVPHIAVDTDILKLLLTNLLSNACKYTPTHGHVYLKIAQNSTKLHASSQGSIAITVSDDGYGIPKSAQRKIFEKFFRAENIKSKDTDGTGLGLYIVHALLDYVGGSVSFTSQEDKGTSFTVLLPLEGMIPKNSTQTTSMPVRLQPKANRRRTVNA